MQIFCILQKGCTLLRMNNISIDSDEADEPPPPSNGHLDLMHSVEDDVIDLPEIESPKGLYIDEYVKEEEDKPGMFRGLTIDNYTLIGVDNPLVSDISGLEQEVSYQLTYYQPHAEDTGPTLENIADGTSREFEDFDYREHLVHYFIPVSSSGELDALYLALDSDDDCDKAGKSFKRSLDQSVRATELNAYFRIMERNY